MRLSILALVLALCSCAGGPPTHFWTLAPIPPTSQPVPSQGPILRIGNVQLPGDLDRSALVTLDGATDVDIHQQDRWAGPLDQMIQRVLTQDLAARLPGRVIAADDPPPPGSRSITLAVEQFAAGADGTVTLAVDWTPQHGAPHHETITVRAASAHPDAETAAMSQALAQLADRIAHQI